MKPIKCVNGHFYDGEKYDECPHCLKEEISMDKNPGKGIDILSKNIISNDAMKDLESTVETNIKEEKMKINVITPDSELKNSNYEISDNTKTVSIYDEPLQENDNTNSTPLLDEDALSKQKELLNSIKRKLKVEDTIRNENIHVSEIEVPINKNHIAPSDDTKTQILSGSEINPVVGWVVAIEGPHFGESFIINEGKNSIGRGIQNRIQLNKDITVSRSAQAYIIFDSLNDKFLISQGESDSLAYVNDSLIIQPIELNKRAKIKIGKSILYFIPLINSSLTWEKYIDGVK